MELTIKSNESKEYEHTIKCNENIHKFYRSWFRNSILYIPNTEIFCLFNYYFYGTLRFNSPIVYEESNGESLMPKKRRNKYVKRIKKWIKKNDEWIILFILINLFFILVFSDILK